MLRYPFGLILTFLLTFSLLGEVAAQEKKEKDEKKGVDIIITQSPKIIVKLQSVKNNSCFGDNKGAINIEASGGFPPYKYYWSHGDTTQDVTGLKAGKYRVAVYDNFSCSDTLSVTITEPERLAAKVESVKDILCYGYNQGEIDISVSGGVAPYTYSWSNGSKSEDLKGVISGVYSVLITDANGCQEIITAKIEEKPLIIRSVDDVSNILCSGDSVGRIDISVSGGSPPYTYKWSNGATTQDISNLLAGSYDVTVMDSKGCTEVSTVRVIEPKALTLSFDDIKNIRCYGDNGGAINIDVDGGVTPYTYKWSNGATTQDITGISAGNYSVEVVDANGCSNVLQTSITEPPGVNVEITEAKNVSFNNGEDGAIDVSVSGGVAPYTYKWSNGSDKQDLKELKAGNYTLRVSDATGCAKIINTTITQPTSLIVKLDNVQNINCNGDASGLINISVNGGVAPYDYKWSNGETTQDVSDLKAGKYSVVVTDANGFKQSVDTTLTEPPAFIAKVAEVKNILCHGENKGAIDIDVSGGVAPYKYRWSNGMTTQDITDVPVGEYSVKIIDANHCEQNLSATITQPPVMALTLDNVTHIQCNGNSSGAVDVSVSGGVAPYKYVWNNGAETEDIKDVKAGEYSVQVTDANGCVQTISTTIKEPRLLTVKEQSFENVDCYGNNSGSVNIFVSGGVTPYTYNWSNGATTKDISNIKAGDYTVKITDANGCAVTLSKTITQPPKLVRSLDEVVDNSCFGDSKGAVNISVSGGVLPYSYKWNNGATSQDLVSVSAGDYFVQIKDANGCIDSLSATIKQNTALEAALNVVDINCYGEKSGSIDLSVNGGVAPYKYAWSNNATTQDVKSLKAGQYSAIITDAKGCSKSVEAQIVEPPRFVSILESEKDIMCYGENTGAVKVRVSGGVQPYNYKWSNGDTTLNLNNVVAGKYTLTAVDANGCTEKVSATIKQPTAVDYAIKSVTNVNCYGENGGSIDISITGGVGPYIYKWSNGATTQDLVGVPAGKYQVEISEGNGCSKTLEATITQPSQLQLKFDTVAYINCFGEKKGFIDLNVRGGVAPYKYSWSNGATTQDISNLEAGKYTVNVTDANGCTKSISTTVKQPPLLEAVLADIKQIKCYGVKEGAIAVKVRGGVKPYAFKWSNGATTQNLTNIAAGSYTLTITDRNGCSQSLSATITQPSKLVSKLISKNDISCNAGSNGVVNISVVGGTTPYAYTWSNGSKLQDLIDVPAGSYSVGITDANGCKDSTISVTLNEPTELLASLGNVTNILSYGQSTGAIDISVSGGVSPYKYSWSNGAATQDIKNIPSGNYSVRVKDTNGCEKSITAFVKQPPALMAKIESIKEILCSGENTGAIDISVSGGAPPYKYIWSNGDTTKNLVNIPAGDYSVTIEDANGHDKVLNTKITEPSKLNIQIDEIRHLACYNDSTGSVSVTVTGGAGPYKYAWTNGSKEQDLFNVAAGKYSLTVSDANGCREIVETEVIQPDLLTATLLEVKNISCNGDANGEIRINVTGGAKPYDFNWSNGARTQDISGVLAGNYSCKITDANGCTQVVNATISEPPVLVASFGKITNNLCFGESKGAIEVNVSGGSAPYVYHWSNGDSTRNISGLPSGDYSLTIIDAKGCVQNLATTIMEPVALTAAIDDVKNISCYGEKKGAIEVSVAGGTVPYKFNWNNGSKLQNLSNIPVGDYKLTVTDANGCIVNASTEVTQPPLLTLNLDTVYHNLCKGDNKGLADITVGGGVAPYSYTWNNGAITEDIVNVLAGNYSVKVKDANGCTESIAAVIKEPEALSVTLDSIANINCFGDETGAISVKASGGVAPYRYFWNNGASTASIKNVPAGKYQVTVTDANGCTSVLNATIEEPPGLVKTIDAITDIRCNGENTGAIHVTALEGVQPLKFEWNNGATTDDISGLRAGTYKLTITEGNGCVSTLEATVEEPSPFVATIDGKKDVNCFGDETGAIEISAKGGVEPYVYAWSNGGTTPNIENIPADDYSVMITDANGCLNTINTKIKEPEELVLTIDSVRNVKCCGDNSGAIFISVEGGVEPYQYQWSNGATTQDIENLILGKYTVNVTDANGCVISTPEEGMDLYEQVVTQGKFVTRDILFDVAKSTIKPESFSIVNKIATLMKEHPDLTFRIDGHTDSDGEARFNQRLSEDRAKAIKEALIKFGIHESRLYTRGYGETEPIATNATKEGKRLNRRVEFISLTGTLGGTVEESDIFKDDDD
ncbi:OmpA family protein [Fulvivirgaceae bacterium BMA10]|uniref:OmpA family protein n=1 Tax=Splendidivirga corallicola TaxID=3051826 RepID=A0ABT8KJ50_9BACT|nr:OmpA family protein [Fulvivirgaceae bacterium BMA10]